MRTSFGSSGLGLALSVLLAACGSGDVKRSGSTDAGTHDDHDAGHTPDNTRMDFSDASHEAIAHEVHEAGAIVAILEDSGLGKGSAGDASDLRPPACTAPDAGAPSSGSPDVSLTGSCFVTPAELAQHGAGGTADELATAFAISGINATPARALLVFPHTCGVALNCKIEDDPNCETGFVAEFREQVLACYDDACLDATLDVYACIGLIKRCDCLNACDALLDRQDVACAKYQGG